MLYYSNYCSLLSMYFLWSSNLTIISQQSILWFNYITIITFPSTWISWMGIKYLNLKYSSSEIMHSVVFLVEYGTARYFTGFPGPALETRKKIPYTLHTRLRFWF